MELNGACLSPSLEERLTRLGVLCELLLAREPGPRPFRGGLGRRQGVAAGSGDGRSRARSRAVACAGGSRSCQEAVRGSGSVLVGQRGSLDPRDRTRGAVSARGLRDLRTRTGTPAVEQKQRRAEGVAAARLAIVPAMRDSAWITGITQVFVDPTDPFPEGYLLRQTVGGAGPAGSRGSGQSSAVLATGDPYAAGSVTRKVAPAPGPALSALMWPPCASTIALVIARPMPLPPWARSRARSAR